MGRFVKVTNKTVVESTPEDPPLVAVKVTNPLTYLKNFLMKLLKNSEISISIKIKPMALISLAIAIAIILGGTGFSIWKFLMPHFS